MTTQRKRYRAEFKARMAFEALTGENRATSSPATRGFIRRRWAVETVFAD